MITKKTSLFLFLFIIFYSTILSQNSRIPFRVSPLIGDTLSSAENEYYNLFPKIEGFQHAVFYKNSNDSLDAKVTSLLNTTSREILLKNNFSRTELINHLERVAKAKSFWGMADTSIVQNIIIKTKDGIIKEGKLISVSDSLVIIKPLENESLLEYNKDSTEEYSYLQITSVTIQNDSKVLSGMGTGFLVGAGFGASIGLIDGDDTGGFIGFSAGQKALIGGISLGVVGALIGTAIGAGSSEDEEIIIKTKDDLRYLKKYLRNPFYEFETRKIKSIIKQNTETISKPEISFKKRISISFFGATTSSGPATQIENQMKKSGFDQTKHGGWFSSRDIIHPKSYTGIGQLGTPWLISLKYYYSKTIVLGAFYSENPIGMTMGYNNFGYLDLDYSVNTIATMTWLKYGILSIGGGPALFFTKISDNYGYDENNSLDDTLTGFVFECGVTYPAYTTFYISAMAQYRLMGDILIGPFATGSHDDESIFPITEVSYNHLFIGVGAGIRL